MCACEQTIQPTHTVFVYIETVRLDELVDDMINYFKNNYLIGEIAQCTLNNNEYSMNDNEYAYN